MPVRNCFMVFFFLWQAVQRLTRLSCSCFVAFFRRFAGACPRDSRRIAALTLAWSILRCFSALQMEGCDVPSRVPSPCSTQVIGVRVYTYSLGVDIPQFWQVHTVLEPSGREEDALYHLDLLGAGSCDKFPRCRQIRSNPLEGQNLLECTPSASQAQQ